MAYVLPVPADASTTAWRFRSMITSPTVREFLAVKDVSIGPTANDWIESYQVANPLGMMVDQVQFAFLRFQFARLSIRLSRFEFELTHTAQLSRHRNSDMFDLNAVQAAIRGQQLDGWLLYDFRGLNVLARRALAIGDDAILSRRDRKSTRL